MNSHAFPKSAAGRARLGRRAALPLVLAVLGLAACGGGDEEEEVFCVGACPSRGFIAIEDSSGARSLASAVADASANLVPTGTYNAQVVSGTSGTATVTGTKSYTGAVSCGTDCVSSTHSADMTIVYNDYYAQPIGGATNTKIRITGTVTFTDTRSSRQQGLTFSSSGRMRVAGSNLAVRYEITSSTGAVYGYADTVTMATTSTTGSTWSDGTLTTAAGRTYSW